MILLNVNPDVLEDKARQLDTQRRQDEQIMREMRTLVMNLHEVWEGSAQDAFVQKFLSYQRSMDELQTTLDGFVRESRRAARDARNLDNTLLGTVRRKLSSFF